MPRASGAAAAARCCIAADDYTLSGQFEAPYGILSPIGQYALIAARHMHQYGTTAEQMAEVAVAARRWAQLNPKAWERDPLTVADVLASEMISTPLRRLDCCLMTDGGAAVVITGAERARDAAKRPVRVLGAGESHSHWHISQMPDLTVSPGFVSAREAFGLAGVRPADVDFVQPYDNFTSAVIMHLEDLGFCAKGEGGAFVEHGRLGPRREAAGDDLGRGTLLQPSGHARAPAARGGGPAAAGRGRRAPGSRSAPGRRPRHRRSVVRRGRHGGAGP